MKSYFLHWDTRGYLIELGNGQSMFMCTSSVRKLPQKGDRVLTYIYNSETPKLGDEYIIAFNMQFDKDNFYMPDNQKKGGKK